MTFFPQVVSSPFHCRSRTGDMLLRKGWSQGGAPTLNSGHPGGRPPAHRGGCPGGEAAPSPRGRVPARGRGSPPATFRQAKGGGGRGFPVPSPPPPLPPPETSSFPTPLHLRYEAAPHGTKFLAVPKEITPIHFAGKYDAFFQGIMIHFPGKYESFFQVIMNHFPGSTIHFATE